MKTISDFLKILAWLLFAASFMGLFAVATNSGIGAGLVVYAGLLISALLVYMLSGGIDLLIRIEANTRTFAEYVNKKRAH